MAGSEHTAAAPLIECQRTWVAWPSRIQLMSKPVVAAGPVPPGAVFCCVTWAMYRLPARERAEPGQSVSQGGSM